MPPSFLFDLSSIDLNAVVADPEEIRKYNPQRGAMEHLNAISWFDHEGRLTGYKDVRDDEFWVEGHIPGRPLLPGVIMLEAAAQLCSFYVKGVLKTPGFVGFGGVEDTRFRQAVQPGVRLHLLGRLMQSRHSRFTSKIQGIVNGVLVFETTIIGAIM
jgi:3-hydroxyacyl-[acyl-carrier-protein] dehydratase